MNDRYDLIIIGSGPAGAAAAIYAARAQMRTLWLDSSFIPGGQVAESGRIDNYPGLPGILGADLGEAFASHAEKLGMEPKREKVLSIEPQEGYHLVRTKKHTYETLTVICALGAEHRHLGIPGEEELAGSGVSYCATCDGAFFRDRTAAVIGGGNTACEDALLLADICEKVYLIHRRDTLRADRILQQKLAENPKVELLYDTVPTEILGENAVTGLAVHNRVTGEDRTLAADGVFVAVGMLPRTELLQGLVSLDASGYVIAGEDCVTTQPGILAAGDLRTKSLRQVVTAVADGASAVHSALDYLHTL